MFLVNGKHITKYYWKYFLFFLVGLVSLVAVDIAQLIIPESIGELVDALDTTGTLDIQSEFFINLIIKVLVVSVIIFLGRILWRLSLFYASKKIEEELRMEMFEKAEKLDIAFYHEKSVGYIMNYFTNDLETLEEFIGWGTLMAIDGVFLTAYSLYKMFMLDVALALIILIPIALLVVWGMICENGMSTRWKLRQESSDAMYNFTQENFTGIRVIKAFVKETKEIHKFAKIARENQEINVKFTMFAILFDTVIGVIIAVVSVLILGFGGYFAYMSITHQPVEIFNTVIELTPGRLITFYGYFTTSIWPLIALGQVVTMYSKAKTSYKRIGHFLDTEIEIKDKEGVADINVEGKITFNHFSFSYPHEDKEILSDISLTINKGEKIGIIGRVGSGKSTLVNVLLRLYNLKEGTLFIDDKDIMDITLKSVRDGISIAPQDNFLFSDTIDNNIALRDETKDVDEVIRSAKFSDITKDIELFKDGYNTVLAELGQTVSGGQKQRISLARAFYSNPAILILDDSVSAVDMKTEETILKNINENREGKTTIIIASRVSTVMSMDKIIVLNKGHLEAFDTPKNLLKISDTFQKMYLLQKLEAEKGEKFDV